MTVFLGILGCNLLVFGLGILTGVRLFRSRAHATTMQMETVDCLRIARAMIIRAQEVQEWGLGENWKRGLLDSIDSVVQREHDVRIRVNGTYLNPEDADFNAVVLMYQSWPNWGEHW